MIKILLAIFGLIVLSGCSSLEVGIFDQKTSHCKGYACKPESKHNKPITPETERTTTSATILKW